MAFRAKETAIAIGLTLTLGAAAEVRVEVRHRHFRGYADGTLTATEERLAFAENNPKSKHGWSLAWADIQQLRIGRRAIQVLSYADTWKLGADREYELEAAPGQNFEDLYATLKGRLDQRLVAAMADVPEEVLWRIPAKLREAFGGPEGTLIATGGSVIFESAEKGKSRTWRFSDIDNISSSGPFELALTTFERGRDFGNRKTFNFQLKEPVAGRRYEALWRRLNQSRDLEFIRSVKEKQQ